MDIRTTVIATLALLATLTPSPARADRARARQFFLAGQQAFEKKDYLTAIRAFQQSHASEPHPNTIFAMAGAHRRQFQVDRDVYHLRKAIDLYGQFVALAPGSPYRATADNELIQLLAVLARRPAPPASAPSAPPPPPTQLMVTSDTPGARVQIDGAPAAGEPAPAIRVVDPGTHRIRLTAPGHGAAERAVTAVPKRLVVTNIDLEPLPGRLRVMSSVDGATVYVDGKGVGKTPLFLRGLPAGRRTVAVGHRGHRPWSETLEIKSDDTSVAVANLTWSRQRRIAVATGVGAGALGLAGLVTGLLTLQADSRLDGLPTATNAERRAFDDNITRRDRLAIASTVLFAAAGAALVTAAVLYWFDSPGAPVTVALGKHAKLWRGAAGAGLSF